MIISVRIAELWLHSCGLFWNFDCCVLFADPDILCCGHCVDCMLFYHSTWGHYNSIHPSLFSLVH